MTLACPAALILRSARRGLADQLPAGRSRYEVVARVLQLFYISCGWTASAWDTWWCCCVLCVVALPSHHVQHCTNTLPASL